MYMLQKISATKARDNFADLLNRIQYRGEEFIIEKQGKPVAVITVVNKAIHKGRTKAVTFNPPVFDMGGEKQLFTREEIYE